MSGRASQQQEDGRGRGNPSRSQPGRAAPGRGTYPGRVPPGRGTAARGRGTPSRGGRSGIGYATPPPPPPGSGRGRGGGTYSAGPGRGSYSRAPQQQYQQYRQSPVGRGSPAAGGRGYAPSGRGYAAASGGSGGSPSFAISHGGVGGGKLFGHGAGAVAYDRDKEREQVPLWKVGPPAGQRFSTAWLRGLTAFVAWRYQQQQQQGPPPPATPLRRQQRGEEVSRPLAAAGTAAAVAVGAAATSAGQEAQSSAQQQQQGQGQAAAVPSRPPVTAERLPTAAPVGPPVVAERPEPPAKRAVHGSGEEEAEPGSLPVLPSPAAEAAGDEEAAGPIRGAGSRSGASTPGSDLGWADVLAAAAAAAPEGGAGSAAGSLSSPASPARGGSADAGSAVSSSSGGGAADAESSPSCRSWWPASPASLANAQPVAVDEQPAGAATPQAGGRRVQLSLRLERMGLTDREVQMVADWCCQHASMADIRKLWLFDNRLGDEGAAAVAQILASHPGMLEVHLSHNLLTLRGAQELLAALPVPAPEPAAPAGCSEGLHPEPVAAAQGVSAGAGGGISSEASTSQQAAPGRVPAAEAAGTAVAASSAAAASAGQAVWLRLEWNRISLEGLMQVLEAQHAQRGLIADLPSALRADAAPSLPDLPPYLAAAAAASPAAPTSSPASRGARNALQFLVDRCHARLPWISCQYQLPSEAAVLKAARRSWRKQPEQAAQQDELAPAPPAALAADVSSPPGSPAAAAGPAATAAAPSDDVGAGTPSGPLLLFPDTSALLPMLGAAASVATPTFFTLDLLAQLAQQGHFGRALPAHEQVFVIVTDSVLKQLDGLKNDPAVRPAVRRFLGQGLDACGPAGANFLTVLGAHEGEGLLVEHDAAVTGSRSTDVSTKGQRADHKIVEVALYFQQEVLRESQPAASTSSGSDARCIGSAAAGATGGSSAAGAGQLAAASFPVLLLSGDNAQVQTARSHGLPAVRMADLAAAQRQLESALGEHLPLTASLLRSCLGGAAVTGLGAAAMRSLQAEFDDAITALAAATDALAAGQQQLAAVAAAAQAGGDPAEVLAAVRQAVGAAGGGGSLQLLPALQASLAAWQQRVTTHQDPSRVLRWAASGTGSGP